jgi:uncharacterized protein (TIGR00725 family)
MTEERGLTSSAGKKVHLVVIGSAADHCTKEASELAYRVGAEAARRGAVVLTGGLGGVMESACKGAKENHGITVGIIPQDEAHYANEYCDVVIATGIGWARDFATAYSADAIILIGGGAGALIETCAGYLKGKPIIAIEGSGGIADQTKGTFLDERKNVIILSERDPERAVARALELARQRSKSE